MENLPVVLGGPIVRRVEPRLVAVWMALKSDAQVALSIWKGLQTASTQVGSVTSGDTVLATGSTPTRSFGENLHIVTVVAEIPDASPGLDPATVYSYDLTFNGTSLRTAGLLTNEPASPRLPGVDPEAPRHLALGYEANRLPSFVTPANELAQLRLAHASCRKPHGPDHDAMAWLDDEIEKNLDKPTMRIQQLFLTGDQIYADDVASCLLPMVNRLGVDLLGAPESVRMKMGSAAETGVEVNLTNFPAMFRQRVTRELAGFSSMEAHSHLLSFGEYAAMYLAAWSPRVWRPLAKEADVVKIPAAGSPVADHLTKWEECRTAKGKSSIKEVLPDELDFAMEEANVVRFREAVPKVARALANAATYMIFDDHEITDDWNLNARWRTAVNATPLGKNIVRNGVMAYSVFQAWGNDPKAFVGGTATNHNQDLLTQTQSSFSGNGPYPSSSASVTRIDELVGTTGTHDKQPTFHYTVPGPKHQVAVLDTRTRRTYRGTGVLPPKLLGTSLDAQVPNQIETGRLQFILSPAPVLGPWLIETIAAPVLQLKGDIQASIDWFKSDGPFEPTTPASGSEKYDAEAWSGDEVAFEAFLKRLSGLPHAVILSGDVHYACTMVLDYWKKAEDTQPVRIAQLTSSASHNVFHETIQAVLRSNALLQRFQSGPVPERLAWDGPAPIQLPAGAKVAPGRKARMRRSPALLPTWKWPTNSTFPDDKKPDWSWRLSLVRDQRSDAVRYKGQPDAAPPKLTTDVSLSDPGPGYRLVAARHSAAALNHFDHLRQMLFTNNVGVITLGVEPGGAPTVVHTLLSRDRVTPSNGAAYTAHNISLAPTSAPRPKLEFE